jgi:hypothetical protein
MKLLASRLLPFVAAGALFGCAEVQTSSQPAAMLAVAAPHPPAAAIDAATLQAMYAVPHREDGTVMHGSHEGAQWTKWAKPDGSMELLAGHGLFADSGKYVIRGNLLCTTWGHIDSGHENCVRLVQISTDEYMTYGTDGTEGSRFEVHPP